MFKAGYLINQRYEVLNKLGKGGTSEVYLVRHVTLDTLMALKAIFLEDNTTIDYAIEAHLLKDLRHKNLPRIIDTFEYDNMLCIVRDYIEGETVQDYIDKQGPLLQDDLLLYVNQIIDILAYLHSQPTPIVYRDLKPSNLMLDEKGNIFLIDFGTTRVYDPQKDNDTLYLGTRGYAAPEQFGGHQSDERTDIYALGATIYYLHTGEHWHEVATDDKWKKFSNAQSNIIKELISKCMQLMPDERYQSVGTLKNALSVLGVSDDAKTELLSSGEVKGNITSSSKVTIAVMGGTRGCGTTHIGLGFAVACNKRFSRTVFIERKPSKSIDMLQRFVEDAELDECINQKTFKYSGVEFIRGDLENDFYHVISSKHKSVVIDYGTHHHLIQDFLRAQFKYFILPSSPWCMAEKSLVKDIAKYEDVYFIVNLSDVKTVNRIAESYDIKKNRIHCISYFENPLKYSEKHENLNRIIGFKKQSKFSKLFRR